MTLSILLLAATIITTVVPQAYGTRPAYVYDKADILSNDYEMVIDQYTKFLDDITTAEIVVYTIPSFEGHGIMKDGQEIRDRDQLANHIFNEVSLDGLKGIGKKGKDNGILVLYSTTRDTNGGSIRIEVGRGLEGNVTNSIASEILDLYLVPARAEFEQSGNKTQFNEAILKTVVVLGYQATGFNGTYLNPMFALPSPYTIPEIGTYTWIVISIFMAIVVVLMSLFSDRIGSRNRFAMK